MKTTETLKQLVREKYEEIALQSKAQNDSSCCGSGCGTSDGYTIMSDDYSHLKGYNPDADLGLGCGLPTTYAQIQHGDTVIDLGSGAGNDCFIARSIVGDTGKIIGIDMTQAMIEKAIANTEKMGFNNVEFRLGEIENIPVSADQADVVISNCVLNLVPDKRKAFQEILRVLKPGGHFSISDIVLSGELPDDLKKLGEMYAGCVAGAIQKPAYLSIIEETGFVNIKIQKEKSIVLPDDMLVNYLSASQINAYRNSGSGIYSITVYAEKQQECCNPSCCK